MDISSMYRKSSVIKWRCDGGGLHHVGTDITPPLALVQLAGVGSIPPARCITPTSIVITTVVVIIVTPTRLDCGR